VDADNVKIKYDTLVKNNDNLSLLYGK
jgi:hypothetical protein